MEPNNSHAIPSEGAEEHSFLQREYWCFISYRHADNKVPGRQWATWLHQALETYEVPEDLIGEKNDRGDVIPARIFPVFRDEEELPANAELSKPIEVALQRSRFMVVLCSPQAVQSEYVAREILRFKQLGGKDRILAAILEGEPGATEDVSKGGPERECFPLPLRFSLDETTGELSRERTEPIAADFRGADGSIGWTTGGAHLEALRTARVPDHLAANILREYEKRRQLMLLKIIAGVLGVPLGVLTQRDKAYQLEKQKQRARNLRRWLTVVTLLAVAALAGGFFAWRQWLATKAAEEATALQLKQTNHELERAEVQEGRTWMERARLAQSKGDTLGAIMLAGRSMGFSSYGRTKTETSDFRKQYPLLLAKKMEEANTDAQRKTERGTADIFIHVARPTYLPIWCSAPQEKLRHAMFSQDGRRFTTVSVGGIAKVWDAATGQVLAELEGSGKDFITSLTYSPDGTLLGACLTNRTIQFWDAFTGKRVDTIFGVAGPGSDLVISPDGNTLGTTGMLSKTLQLWDRLTKKEIRRWEGHPAPVNSIAFNMDGTRLASASTEGSIRLWDVADGKLLLVIPDPQVSKVLFSPDGKTLASHHNVEAEISFWNVATGEKRSVIKANEMMVNGMAFTPDGGRLVTVAGGFRIWSVAEGKELSNYVDRTNLPMSLALSPDGTRALSCHDQKFIVMRDIAQGKEMTAFWGHQSMVFEKAYSPDGALVASCSADKTVRLWDAETGRELFQLKGVPSITTKLLWRPDGKTLACVGQDKSITLWDLRDGSPQGTLTGNEAASSALSFSPDGQRIAAFIYPDTLKVWDTNSLTEIARMRVMGESPFALKFTHDGKDLALSFANEVMKMWSVEKQQEHATLSADQLSFLKVWRDHRDEPARSPDGNLLLSDEVLPDLGPMFLMDARKGKPDLAARLRTGLLTYFHTQYEPHQWRTPQSRTEASPMLHVRNDTLAQLAEPGLTPERQAYLEMLLCVKAGQHRAAMAQWDRYVAVMKVAEDDPMRRLYLITLIDAVGRRSILGDDLAATSLERITAALSKPTMQHSTVLLGMTTVLRSLVETDHAGLMAQRQALQARLQECASSEWVGSMRKLGLLPP